MRGPETACRPATARQRQSQGGDPVGGGLVGTLVQVPYPPRPQLAPLPEFRGTATSRPSPQLRERLVVFVLTQYSAGRSLREIAELTDRSFSAIRNLLDRQGVHRRPPGAPPQQPIHEINARVPEPESAGPSGSAGPRRGGPKS